jgi:hypothetical protein
MGFSFLLANADEIIRKKELTTLTKGCGEVKPFGMANGKAFTTEGTEDHRGKASLRTLGGAAAKAAPSKLGTSSNSTDGASNKSRPPMQIAIDTVANPVQNRRPYWQSELANH